MSEKLYANRILWSDVDAFEVIRKVSEKTYEVRKLKAIDDPNWKPDFVPGGFVGHTFNDSEREWTFEPDESRPVIRIRLHKDGWFKDSNGMRFEISDRPRKYYDSNF